MDKREKVVKYIVIALIVIGVVWIISSFINSTFHSDIVFNFKVDSIEIPVNSSQQIEYELNKNLSVNWKSDNNDVVTVNNGIITGVGLGIAMINGTVISDNKEFTRSCYVSTYYGEKNIELNEIIVPEGELFITKGDSYKIPIEYNPSSSYINSIDYNVVDNNIVTFDGTVIAKNIGTTEVSIIINRKINKTIVVNVIDEVINPTFSKAISDVQVAEESISLKLNETKKIEYTIEPNDAFIKSVKWESSDWGVVDVNENGVLTAKSPGKSIIKLTINNDYYKEIEVIVNVPVTGIALNSNPKLVMKAGNEEIIRTSVLPSNATNKKVKYTNSNPSSISVDQNGKITALSPGNGIITITTEEGNYQKVVTYTVNPRTGVINGTGDIWGYTSSIDQIPVRADLAFFQQLASKGKGILNGNIYIYSDSKRSYKYDISKSILTINQQEILMRMYYPKNVDLSMVNTFTFMDGTGPAVVNFGSFLGRLDRNPKDMSSSGIQILVSTTIPNKYNVDHVILSTEFVKSIVDQKPGVKNAVGGFSGSGWTAGDAANNGPYDRLVISNSRFYADKTTNVKNKEVIMYLPREDKVIVGTTTLNYMSSLGYTDVTLISNDTGVINTSRYSSKFLIVNPVGKTWAGHNSANIISAKVFSYACR